MKKNVLQILLDLIFVILFNMVFFAVGGTEHPASVWVSYAFIHIAYLMIIITALLIRKGSSAAVLGMPVYSISTAYFFVEFIVGLIFIFAGMKSAKAAVIAQALIAGIYAAVLLSNLIVNETTSESVERHETELKFVKESSAKLRFLIDNTTDKAMKAKLKRAYDIVHASQVRSNIAVRRLELDVMEQIRNLNSIVVSGSAEQADEVINRIIFTVNERNTQLKLMN